MSGVGALRMGIGFISANQYISVLQYGISTCIGISKWHINITDNRYCCKKPGSYNWDQWTYSDIKAEERYWAFDDRERIMSLMRLNKARCLKLRMRLVMRQHAKRDMMNLWWSREEIMSLIRLKKASCLELRKTMVMRQQAKRGMINLCRPKEEIQANDNQQLDRMKMMRLL